MKTVLAFLSVVFLSVGTTVRAADDSEKIWTDASADADAVVWFDLMVKNTGRAQLFYHQVFGWDFVGQENGYLLIQANGKSIGGLMRDAKRSPPGGVSIYLPVVDVAVTLAKAKASGAHVILSPRQIPGGHGNMALFSDLDGNPVGVIEAERN